MYNTRRSTRDGRLDSSPFVLEFRLPAPLCPAFTALVTRGQQHARAQLSSLVHCECVYFNGEVPRVYSAEEGWSSLPPMVRSAVQCVSVCQCLVCQCLVCLCLCVMSVPLPASVFVV